MDHRDTHTHTHTAAHQPTHFTPYQSLGSKCPMKCNVVEQIQGLYLGWLTPGWDAKNTAFILGELIIITRQALAAPPSPSLLPFTSDSAVLLYSTLPSVRSGLCRPSVRRARRVRAWGVCVLGGLGGSELR